MNFKLRYGRYEEFAFHFSLRKVHKIKIASTGITSLGMPELQTAIALPAEIYTQPG